MANLIYGLIGGGQTATGKGSTTESSQRSPKGSQRPILSVTERALLGQLANPPNTAISTPLQQAISNAQGGFPTMRQNFGLGGGLVNQLTGQGVGAGPQGNVLGNLLPSSLGGQGWGMQSREQLGLPDRRSYFTFLPTPEQLQTAGAVPPIRTPPQTGKLQKREAKLEGRIERRQAAGKGTAKAERKLSNIQARLA